MSPASRTADREAEEQFARMRAYLDETRATDGATSFRDVVALAEITAASMQAFFASIDATIYRELREIADYIGRMRTEITALEPGDLKANRLPKAGEDLWAIVGATEDATNQIMECAEDILSAANRDDDTLREVANAKVMDIFQACSFQDITGQRIARVIETLQHIEQRVGRFAAAVQPNGDLPDISALDTREARARELLLHGPQSADTAIRQDEVDALLRS
ncbi:protein phosphatase CheZ [Methylopila musalis]|uniref:Protein phosphatase CheZ n=1 Tax=Methylopila musalis TaxID=1134781 RepID=A0ABW3Z961_9HYPH